MPKTDFMIGADPEFGFLNGRGQLKEAYTLIDDPDQNEPFGLDGCDSIAELRPAPAYSPIKLVSNIRTAMVDGIRENKIPTSLEWKAGSEVKGHPIGGHIHLGIRPFMKPGVGGKVVRCLDNYLAPTVLLLEAPEEASHRREHGYGRLSDHRTPEHGIEYRVPSSWLTSPYIAAGVLCLAKTIVWDCLFNGLDEANTFELDYDKFLKANQDVFRVLHEEKTWPAIQKMELYAKFADQIGLLDTLIDSGRTWFPTCSMKDAWAIDLAVSPPKPLKRKSLERIWS